MIHQMNHIGYWIPYDAKRRVGEWITNDELLDYSSGINSKHLVLISNSCFSGSLLKTAREGDSAQHYLKLKEKNQE